MAQRFSAGAKVGDGTGDGPDAEAEADERRRRAAAYVDLWERQLSYVAAQGAPPIRRRRQEKASDA
ncbi:hypothetical protein [Amaricoccus sp.]|uniref:hypothetical protein n=1 Tax=Amaricoccus sp. TaxID=1872485 RepID=UPI001B65D526|nr:hypothetical protein [Amaricoccus sp.]MBP7242500.1 hypothetical protein [Amaricoccus sp.]